MVLRKLTTSAMASSMMITTWLYASTLVLAADICDQVVTCRKNGGAECNRTTQACPPCIYALADKYTCWEKDNVTNTCPFTGVKYDCSTAWATTSTNATATPTAAATGDKSKLIMYAAIGGGALLLILLLVVICVRRRRRARNMPQFGMHSPQAFHTKRGGAKSAHAANTPYAYSNGPTTGKNANYTHHQRKRSDPVLLESSAVNVGHSNDYDTSTNTTSDSLDAMLTDNTPPTAVLGDPPLPKTRSKRGLSRGFSRLNSGGSSRRSSAYSDKISRNDVPTSRYTATHHPNANVLDEYLKMKQEMHFDSDAVSDYVSDTMSDRFSLQSSSTIGGTESEYLGDLMRSRTESECFSEMSYNDEKYSFSEDDTDSVLGASVVGKKVDKEVEI